MWKKNTIKCDRCNSTINKKKDKAATAAFEAKLNDNTAAEFPDNTTATKTGEELEQEEEEEKKEGNAIVDCDGDNVIDI